MTRAARPAHNRTDTSIAAAESVRDTLNAQQKEVFEAIKFAGADGMTNNEIHDEYNILLQSVCARVDELKTKHRIRYSGQKRLQPSGRTARVWIAEDPDDD